MNSRASNILRRALKIFGVVAGLVVLSFSIMVWVVFKEKDEWLLSQIQTYMRESQSGDLKIGTIELRLLKNFPDVTLALDSIDYYEHVDSLRSPTEKPILHAAQLFVAVELLPLLNDELRITEISINKAQVNIVEYANGVLNVNRALAKPVKPKKAVKKVAPKQKTHATPKQKKTPPPPAPKPTPKPETKKLQIDLEDLSLREILITWKTKAAVTPEIILLKELDCNLSGSENLVAIDLYADHHIQALKLNNVVIPSGDFSVKTNLLYNTQKQQLSIDRSEIVYDVFSATLEGNYNHQKNQYLELKVDASSNDLQLLSAIIKPEVLKSNPDLLKEVDVFIHGKIFGELATQPPQVALDFGLKNLNFKFPKRPGSFKKIGFDGHFSSGMLPDYSKASLEINNIGGQLPGGFIKGRLHLRDFVNPYLSYDVTLRAQLDAYDEIFQMDQLQELKGHIDMDAHFDGRLKNFDTHSTDNTRHSSITLANVSFYVTKTKQSVTALSGKIENKNNVASLHQFQFVYGQNDFLLNAQVENLAHYILNQQNEINATGSLQSRQLYTKDIILDTTLTAQIQDRISNLSFHFKLNTTTNKINPTSPNLAFEIQNLTATLDKLPDIKLLNIKGLLAKPATEAHLTLQKFEATLPHGKVNVTGELFIPQKDLWKFNAHARLNKFPWTYVRELVAELREDDDPHAKNLSVKEMDILHGDLFIEAAIIPYPFDVTRVTIDRGWASFTMPGAGIISAKNIKVALDHLHFIHPQNTGFITGLKSTKGTMALKQVKVPGMDASDYNINLTGKDNLLNIDFVRINPTIKKQTGQLTMNVTKREIDYQLHINARSAKLEYFIEKFANRKNLLKGFIDYTVNLNTHAADWNSVKKNLNGSIEITGSNLTLYGIDVDDALERYEQSQNFNLTDLGAVVVAGPIGLAVTKGSDFVSLTKVNLDSTQETNIQTLFAKWKLENGQIITEDVAFATPYNRIAFNGKIDFEHDSIPGLTIAVVDKHGCSLMDQKLHGKMNNLQTGKLNITKTLLGSVINFMNAVVGKDCTPIYTGRVKAPAQQ